MPFYIEEEEVREHFQPAGLIKSIRLIRDKDTHIGKGIGYIQFSAKEEMRKAINDFDGSKLKGRDLRVK